MKSNHFSGIRYTILLVVKAILLGFLISSIGVVSWAVIATYIPMPWAFLLMSALLVVYWNFFSGSWGSQRLRKFLNENFRKSHLSSKTWFWSLIGVILIVLIEQSGLVVTFRLIEFPAERFLEEYRFLGQVPRWIAWMVVVMIATVAGICEEVGFRGYMQVPLEKRFGPVISIGIVSIVFVLVHLHQAWSGPILIHIFFISALFGAIAYYSQSLLPGIIAHIIMDIFNFAFWWSDLVGQFDKKPISATGIDVHFVLWILVFLMSVVFFLLILRSIKHSIIEQK